MSALRVLLDERNPYRREIKYIINNIQELSEGEAGDRALQMEFEEGQGEYIIRQYYYNEGWILNKVITDLQISFMWSINGTLNGDHNPFNDGDLYRTLDSNKGNLITIYRPDDMSSYRIAFPITIDHTGTIPADRILLTKYDNLSTLSQSAYGIGTSWSDNETLLAPMSLIQTQINNAVTGSVIPQAMIFRGKKNIFDTPLSEYYDIPAGAGLTGSVWKLSGSAGWFGQVEDGYWVNHGDMAIAMGSSSTMTVSDWVIIQGNIDNVVTNVGATAGDLAVYSSVHPSGSAQISGSKYVPASALVTAGDAQTSSLRYNAHLRNQGMLYGGTTDPTNEMRLNYDGNFHATKLYQAERRVLTLITSPIFNILDESTVTTFSTYQEEAGKWHGTTGTNIAHTAPIGWGGNLYATNMYTNLLTASVITGSSGIDADHYRVDNDVVISNDGDIFGRNGVFTETVSATNGVFDAGVRVVRGVGSGGILTGSLSTGVLNINPFGSRISQNLYRHDDKPSNVTEIGAQDRILKYEGIFNPGGLRIGTQSTVITQLQYNSSMGMLELQVL